MQKSGYASGQTEETVVGSEVGGVEREGGGGTEKPEEPEYYDPNIDDEDTEWVEKQRRGHESDAILSCPACLTTLCLDCQRHVKYVTQYRAMFVQSCRVSDTIVLREQFRSKRRKGVGGRRGLIQVEVNNSNTCESVNAVDGSSNNSSNDDDCGDNSGGVEFKPVYCEACGTEVAAMDQDEVYHFFNVVASCS